MQLIDATRQLARCCGKHRFSPPVACVYNPLQYARAAHEQYLQKYGGGSKRAVFIGMNPGPYGMGQTGIPFGDVVSVRDYLQIEVNIKPPAQQHTKRPIQGLDCPRVEVSGSRLWGLFAERYGSAEQFFSEYFVINYCPLLFLGESGANITPDKLPAAENAPLYRCCDNFLKKAVLLLQPQLLLGIGGFAEKRLRYLFADSDIKIGSILHPSPASPAANRGFSTAASQQLQVLGL